MMGLIVVAIVSLLIVGVGFFHRSRLIRQNSEQTTVTVSSTKRSEEKISRTEQKKEKTKQYTVQANDTLASIAERCDMSINQLADLNDMKVSTVLKVGESISVPADKYRQLVNQQSSSATQQANANNVAVQNNTTTSSQQATTGNVGGTNPATQQVGASLNGQNNRSAAGVQ